MRRWALAALLAGACGSSHGPGDAGADGGPRVPLLPPAESPCDAGGFEPSCGRLGCYPRCGPGCSECPPGTRCVDPGICVPRGDADAGCWDTMGPDLLELDSYCPRGGPCLGRASADGGFSGHCVDEDTCRAAEEAGAELECRWYGWSRFEDGPPDGTCPEQDPRDPFCGGVCPEVNCPRVFQGTLLLFPGDCVGVSERRAFGLCRWTTGLCTRPAEGEELPPIDVREDREKFGDQVACMRLAEQVESGHEDEAVYVLASACRAYRARYPDSVECMDAHWNPLE